MKTKITCNLFFNFSFVLTCINLICVLFFTGCSTSQKSNIAQSDKEIPDSFSLAFPGAEGFGKYTTGGRGGKIMVVNNLHDLGKGSFREAAESTFPRTIVFAVSGTIHLEKKVTIQGDVTIAGQSAPGDGICIADKSVVIGGNNIIVRFLRFRLGDKYQKGGMIDGNGGDDAFGGTKKKNIVIDHCSFSWSTDEVFSIYAGDSTSVQWNLIAEPLNYSYHFETGDSDYEKHGFGAIWGGIHASFHHNLFAHCKSRTPRFNGIRHTNEEHVDYRNNVIYNWGINNVYAGEGGRYNIVNNYYKPGPSTESNKREQIVNPFKRADIPFGKWYVNGNYVYSSTLVTNENVLGVKLNEGNENDLKDAIVSAAFPYSPIATEHATIAFDLVLKNTGCIYPKRDTLDQRIINDVINGTGRSIDVQGGYPHGTAYELTSKAWPDLKQAPALSDSDSDGIPDEWEKLNGLDSNNPNDANEFKFHKHYTNIEVYLNSLLK